MRTFYLYKNKMTEKDLSLEWNVDISDLSALGIDESSLESIDIDEVLEGKWRTGNDEIDSSITNPEFDLAQQKSSVVDKNVFLDSWDNLQQGKNILKDEDNLWKYLRRFFISSILILLGVVAIAALYLFSTYIKAYSDHNPDPKKQEYIDKYKDKYKQVKSFIWSNKTYESPKIWETDASEKVDEIINANDIDYIEKKELLFNYVSDLVRNTEDRVVYAENLKQDIAKQWFLPEELWNLLSEDQAIDTIQRSLNALEVIKFSTATRVFSYMNTALSTISEMIRDSWVNTENIRNLLETLNSRWEKDISSYVYMCYLNPFEVNANCDTVWDLDLYYKIAKDNSIDIKLFKNAMNAISQLLEKQDTTLFSITFNWFNASDKNIKFNIEVYTNQEDEKALMSKWKKNPNIFILTSIINLLKQSSFIIGWEINTKEINVDTRTLSQWSVSRTVNYSTMDFTVPIQKNTEREIFDYIDIDSMKRLLLDRWFKEEDEVTKEEELETRDWEIDENWSTNENNETIDINPEINEEIDSTEIDNTEIGNNHGGEKTIQIEDRVNKGVER